MLCLGRWVGVPCEKGGENDEVGYEQYPGLEQMVFREGGTVHDGIATDDPADGVSLNWLRPVRHTETFPLPSTKKSFSAHGVHL